MKLKQALAELYSNYNMVPAEFRELQAFKILETKHDFLKEIEGEGLPEVIKLICCSEKLSYNSWAEKYKVVQSIYRELSTIKVEKYLKRMSADEFNEKILNYADTAVIFSFQDYADKITNMASQATEAIDENEDTKERTKKEKRNAEISAAAEAKETYADYFWYIKRAYTQLHDEAQLTQTRERVYKIAAEWDSRPELVPEEIQLIQEIIQTGTVEDKWSEKLSNAVFQRSFLLKLTEQYDSYAIPVLVFLYGENIIDLEQEPYKNWLLQHGMLLFAYLTANTKDNQNLYTDPDSAILYEYAVSLTISELNDKNISFISQLWNQMNDRSFWCWVCDQLGVRAESRMSDPLVYFAACLEGRAAGSFAEFLISEKAAEYKIDAADVVSGLVALTYPHSNEVAVKLTRSLMGRISKKSQHLSITQNAANKQCMDLFSAIYRPLEELEVLGTNLYHSSRPIEPKTIGLKMMEQLADLRDGLQVMKIMPLEDVDAWLDQETISYSSERHELDSGEDADKVQLRTMGFAYVNESDEPRMKRAQVIDVRQTEKKNEIPERFRKVAEKNIHGANDKKNQGYHGKQKSKKTKASGHQNKRKPQSQNGRNR